MATQLSFSAVPLEGDVAPGEDLVARIDLALRARELELRDGDVLIIAQKIVSKSEGRYVDLRSVQPSTRAMELAAVTRKDPRLVELILSESTDVVRAAPNVLIVRHQLGFVMANAGIDRSNVQNAPGEERVLLLPLDPDRSAEQLRLAMNRRTGTRCAVIISDSFGRPWRIGTVNIALGSAGLAALVDRRGESDLFGRRLEQTQVAVSDALAAGSGLVMGEAAEGTPIVLARGWSSRHPATKDARLLIRPLGEDLFS